ncbi:MAG: prephenate dehydrogenase [Candidatus Omnitrophica bacterium]|nr:prephenate dehydrogenase [Candidatus Omnitrophota bacterium]
MKPFQKAAIIGTGFIGGSLALDLRKYGLAKEIVGVSRHTKSLERAKKICAIDSGSLDLNIANGADLLIFSAPVNVIIDLAPRLTKIVSKNCIVTDVGSTKESIVKSLERLFPKYIGSHPLAGSEKRGVQYAHKDLFKNSLCILTPTRKSDKRALKLVERIWKKSGAKTILLTPQLHDEILAVISHLPHIAAFSLIASVPDNFLKFASGGLKDTTRIAGSDSELWAQIFLSNRKNLLENIAILQNNISLIKSAIKNNDIQRLSEILEKAKNKRGRIR